MKTFCFILVLFCILLIGAIFETKSISAEKIEPKKIYYSALIEDARRQVECLAQNIYYEARAESEEGQLAVALVTLNRVSSHLYPEDICHVVREKLGKTCQFTWWCDTKLKNKAVKYQYNTQEKEVYDNMRKIALFAYVNYEVIDDITNGALFYHPNYVNPKWCKTRTAKIGKHIFYKLKEDI
jgi:spore germination cell wall hydrolase CwlJ-like protein